MPKPTKKEQEALLKLSSDSELFLFDEIQRIEKKFDSSALDLVTITKSIRGKQGEHGIQGIQGFKGETGIAIDGLDGNDGDDGNDGRDGIDGITPDSKKIIKEIMDSVGDDINVLKKSLTTEIEIKSKGIMKLLPKNPPQNAGGSGATFIKSMRDVDLRGLTNNSILKYNSTDRKWKIGVDTSSGHTIQEEGSDLTARTNLNFVGSTITATDDAGNDATIVTSTATDDTTIDAHIADTTDAHDASAISVNDTFSVIEDTDVQNSLESIDGLLLNARDTGVRYGGDFSINVDTTKLDIAEVHGQILDNTDPENPVFYLIDYAGATGLTVDNTTTDITYWYLDNTTTLQQTTTAPTNSEKRTRLYLGRTAWVGGEIFAVASDITPIQQGVEQFADLIDYFGVLKKGFNPSNAGTDLTIQISAGDFFDHGANFWANATDPHVVAFNATDPTTFQMSTEDGGSGSDVTILDVGNYSVAGVVTPIPGSANRASIFTIYKLTATGNIRIQYGEDYYISLTQAEEALQTGLHSITTFSPFEIGGTIIGYVIATKSETDLSNASFTATNTFGELGGGVSGLTGTYLEVSNNLSDLANAGTARSNLGLAIGIDVQAYDANNAFTTDKLSDFAATTSAELAGVISDETGTGSLVFANTPTLVTPNIGAATGMSLNVAGAVTSTGANLTHSANKAVLSQEGASNGLFLQSYGADASTNGKFTLRSYRSDGSNGLITLATDTAGNVGINTTAPSEKFHLQGGIAQIGSPTSNAFSYANREDALIFTRNDIPSTFQNAISNSFSGTLANATMNFEVQTGASTRTTVMTLNGEGDVGIGTSTPSAMLHVAGGIRLEDTLVLTGSIANGSVAAWIDNNNTTTDQSFGLLVDGGTSSVDYNVRFRNASGTELMRLTGAGNLGIGTASPDSKVEISGAGEQALKLTNTSNTVETVVRSLSSIAEGWVGTLTTHPLRIATDNSTAIYIDTSQNVGIGTTSPGFQVEAKGTNATFATTSADAGTTLRINAQNSGIAILETTTNTDLRIRTNSTEAMRITAGGDVGIGTTSPNTKLHVAGSYSSDVGTLANDATPSIVAGDNWLTGGTTSITDFDDGEVGQTIRILAKHSVTITHGTPIQLSGAGNFVMTSGNTLTLTMFETGVWQEVGRK